MSPSLKNMPVSVPPTCARSSTCETAENWPRKLRRVSSFSISGLLTTTRGSEAGGAFAAFALPCGEYLSHAATSASNVRPAPIHLVAGEQPVDRPGFFSASPSVSNSFPEIMPFVLPHHFVLSICFLNQIKKYFYVSCVCNLSSRKLTLLLPNVAD
jgi:hypothetical protein